MSAPNLARKQRVIADLVDEWATNTGAGHNAEALMEFPLACIVRREDDSWIVGVRDDSEIAELLLETLLEDEEAVHGLFDLATGEAVEFRPQIYAVTVRYGDNLEGATAAHVWQEG